ncbi:hypothetical protein B0H14DRAFT_3058758 [Mycena olivaceomarginata]|nr:hypothetical protein B0H14DRAFT_3058758 [Mycena olivaceomarginata]
MPVGSQMNRKSFRYFPPIFLYPISSRSSCHHSINPLFLPTPTDYLLDLGPTITTFDVLESRSPFRSLARPLPRAVIHSGWRQFGRQWSQVDTMLEKSTLLADAAGRAKTALEALEKLPWEGTIQGFRGGPSVDNLACWFTTNWLNTDHEDQMLELLAADLGLSVF